MSPHAHQQLAIIINADDLGLHPAVRRAVEECAAHGTISSASVMANGPDIANVGMITGVSLGAHLNILRGTPLSPTHEVRSLLNEQGNFVGNWATFAQRWMRGALRLNEVRLEWSRQIVALQDAGLTLSHIDGEKHTHCFPALFELACELAQEHAIPWVRLSTERHGVAPFGTPWLRRACLHALCREAQSRVMRNPQLMSAVRMTDSVWGIAQQGASFSAQNCARAFRGVSDGVIEIVCHPGRLHRSDPALPSSMGRIRVQQLWEPELRSLLEDPWAEVAQRNDWKFARFDDPLFGGARLNQSQLLARNSSHQHSEKDS